MLKAFGESRLTKRKHSNLPIGVFEIDVVLISVSSQANYCSEVISAVSPFRLRRAASPIPINPGNSAGVGIG